MIIRIIRIIRIILIFQVMRRNYYTTKIELQEPVTRTIIVIRILLTLLKLVSPAAGKKSQISLIFFFLD